MKMPKADEKDIDAALDAMSVLGDISSGYYPKRDGDECGDMHFDEENPAHLRKFYDLMNATLDAAPGWPGRVIGGMCYVILFDKNRIVDPAADVLELHPRFAQVAQDRDELAAALQGMLAIVSDSRGVAGYHLNGDTAEWDEFDEVDAARAAIAKAPLSEGTASAQRINREVPVVQWERKKPDDSEGGLT